MSSLPLNLSQGNLSILLEKFPALLSDSERQLPEDKKFIVLRNKVSNLLNAQNAKKKTGAAAGAQAQGQQQQQAQGGAAGAPGAGVAVAGPSGSQGQPIQNQNVNAAMANPAQAGQSPRIGAPQQQPQQQQGQGSSGQVSILMAILMILHCISSRPVVSLDPVILCSAENAMLAKDTGLPQPRQHAAGPSAATAIQPAAGWSAYTATAAAIQPGSIDAATTVRSASPTDATVLPRRPSNTRIDSRTIASAARRGSLIANDGTEYGGQVAQSEQQAHLHPRADEYAEQSSRGEQQPKGYL